MAEGHNLFNSLQTFSYGDGKTGQFHSLPQLEQEGVGPISKLPVSIRIVLESVLRNFDNRRITENDIRTLSNWRPNAERTEEIPFVVARIVLQDFTGVPLLVDLAAMRSAVARMGRDAGIIEPLVPVDLVVDHSVQVDFTEVPNALQLNMEMEFKRNRARYQFLKWGMQAFNGFSVVPPGIGIVHQVNLEYLAKGVLEKNNIFYPDTLVGTDSHTTMINGLGIVGWGVGGIEAEAGMLGQPVYFLTPDVVGVHLKGALNPGVTATDLVLTITEMLRKAKVVGKFVEFHGAGAASLTLTDRATIGNMAPEYGATMGFFPVDEESCRYLAINGPHRRPGGRLPPVFPSPGPVRDARSRADRIQPAAGTRPRHRPAQRRRTEAAPGPDQPAGSQGRSSKNCCPAPAPTTSRSPRPNKKFVVLTGFSRLGKQGMLSISGGGDQTPESAPLPTDTPHESESDTSTDTEVEMMQNRPTPDRLADIPADEFPKAMVSLQHGNVVIAAITSCTNTANPGVMLAAGLLAKKAVERGLTVEPTVKTSLAPGSRIVTDYLNKTGLTPYLNELGFQTVGYGCTTCIGNSGPLEPHLEKTITDNDLVVASVLSGNRNFEARVHQNVKANFLMSPPLVVAFALAGRVDIDMSTDPLGKDRDGNPVFLRDLWPTTEEIGGVMQAATDPETYRRLYKDFAGQNPLWQEIPSRVGNAYDWDATDTYIREPPYFDRFSMEPGVSRNIHNARPLAIFGDSVTTDHISPAGAIKPSSPAGLYLQQRNVPVEDFNSYGSRRGNHRVMMRGTFANVRIKNLMVPGVEGGYTVYQPVGEQMSIYDASLIYRDLGVPLADLRRPGVRHGVLARLGRQGNVSARRPRRHRAVLRAHPPLQPGRHGRAALPVPGRHQRPDPRPGRHARRSTWSAWKRASSPARPSP